ncbi:MAG: glycosyltransferase family 4 protein [Pseudodesulfovibrio sp.]
MRIVLFNTSMAHRGGIERAASVLTAGLAHRGHEVHLATMDPEGAPAAFPPDPCVRVHLLDMNHPSANKLGAVLRMARTVFAIRRAVRRIRPDVVISFQGQLTTLTAIACKGIVPVIGAERVHPATYDIGRGWRQLRKWVYPWLAALVLQARSGTEWCAGRFAMEAVTIPNPVLPGARRETDRGECRTVVAAGHLIPRKGFDLLLEAFIGLAARFPLWDVVIYGEGEMRQRLESRIAECGLEGRVRLPGSTPELVPELARGDIFVLPSLAEGFPNVLGEAMACGVPAVAFDCPSGPADIIRHGVDGFLVPVGDVAALADRLAELMGDDALRARFAERAREVSERFSLDGVLDQWEALMRRTVA